LKASIRHASFGLLGLLGVWSCKAQPEREPAGEPPPFHDQILYEGTFGETNASDLPVTLHVDVRRDAIHVGHRGETMIMRRDGSTTLEERLMQVPVRVPNRDHFLVWLQTQSLDNRRVFAARSDQPERSWPVLDYAIDDATAEPIVVGDRVAVVTKRAIVHAPIVGGPPELLALDHKPRGLVSSDAGRLIWMTADERNSFVMSTDASFAGAEVEVEHPRREGKLVGAALVGDGLVVASFDKVGDVGVELVVRRKRGSGSIVELFRAAAPGYELRLLADGTQAWLYSQNGLWWIGADSHAKIPSFTGSVEAIGADDGLLLWWRNDALHVAGQPTIEFHTPVPRELAIGGDDEDVWSGIVGTEVGEAYGVGGLELLERPPGRPSVVVGTAHIEGAIYRSEVHDTARGHVDEIRRCYDAGLAKNPSLRGTIELEYVINEGGAVASVEDLTGDDFADRKVSRCVARSMRQWQFDVRPNNGSVTVRQPIELSPGE
jgi:hypothetical protein